jgi:midasin (ATPase involved in ribosome maturation)
MHFTESLAKELGLRHEAQITYIIGNVIGYYTQFLPTVQVEIETLKKPILKELKDYVKIATWKDVNVFALKESAKRTHYHLNKFVKKFRLGLQAKCNEVILKFHESIPSVPGPALDLDVILDKLNGIQGQFFSNFEVDFTSVMRDAKPTGRFSTIDKLSKKALSISRGVIEDPISLNTCKIMDDVITDLVGQVKQFQELNSSLQAGTQSAKGQKMIRKKLWVDFLKLLEHMGLNPRTSPKYEKMKDAFYIHSRAIFESSYVIDGLKDTVSFGNGKEIIDKSVAYFYRSIARLEAVRKLRIEFSPDISRLEMEKSINFLDHMVNCSILQRERIAEISSVANIMRAVSQELGRELFQEIDLSVGDLSTTVREWRTIVDEIRVLIEKSIMVLNSGTTENRKLHDLLHSMKTQLDQFHLVPTNTVLLPTLERMGQIRSLAKLVTDFKVQLGRYQGCNVSYAIGYLIAYLDIMIEPQFGSTLVQTHSLDEQLETSIEKTLIVIQYLAKPAPEFPELAEGDVMQKGQAVLVMEQLLAVFSHQTLHEWYNSLHELLVAATANPAPLAIEKLRALCPLVDQAKRLLHYRIYQLIVLHKTWTKFAYILANNFYLILKNGFCVPKTEEEEEQGDTEEQVDGTGIGEGVGSKDVSNEIEDQDQVEGLQGEQEQQPDPDKNIKEEKDGLEMDNDFDGKMEDMENAEEEEEDDEKEEGEDPEEQMGDVDDQLADTVDEKMWGDEDEPTKDGKDEKTEKDSTVEKGGAESETVAKQDEEEPEDSNKDSTEKEESKPEESTKEHQGEEEEEGPIHEDDQYEDNHGVDVKPADELGGDEENEMEDLPDQLDFDDDGEEDHDQMDLDDVAQDQNDEGDGSDSEPMQEDPMEPEMAETDLQDHNETMEEDSEEKDPQGEEGEGEETEPKGETEPEETQPEESGEPEPHHGYGEAEELPKEEKEMETVENHSSAPPHSLGGDGEQGEQGIHQETETQKQGVGAADTMQEEQKEDAPDQHGQRSAAKQTESHPESRNQSHQSNPHRSVGDAKERWLSRLRNIADAQDSAPQPMEGLQGDEFEFVKEGEEDQGDQQALGVAEKEQVEKMENLTLDPEQEEVMPPMEDEHMDVDDPVNDPAMNPRSESEHVSKELQGVSSSLHMNPESEGEKQEVQQQDLPREEEQEEPGNMYYPTTVEPEEQQDKETKMEEEPVDIQDYDAFRRDLETRMAEWRQSGQDATESQELWRHYSALTRDLAFSLCEQLRLILEPTQSTKLKGDYRTGKRLNMRKMISYIASQFKKDKIWLRRTKPFKRTYQIMIAMDDSLSMASTHSVQLAFESLTTITTALNQLEAGDLAIVGFGEQVHLVHPFETPWSEEAGAHVLSSFTFSQEGTNVKQLMDQSLTILREARQRHHTSTTVWQLEIILSDGICQDHEYIQNRVHAALEDRIVMVFLVLDTRTDHDSIMNMTNVSYDVDPATQMPVLKMNRYMDTFPFDYYVLVRNVDRLPEILSDILRQFFMVLASS